MEKTTRRHLLKAAAVGGATATGIGAMLGVTKADAQQPDSGDEHAHDNRHLSGTRAHAVVSFGQWEVDLNDVRGPVDRMGAVPPDRNVHKLLPFEAEVDAGGAVSFVISGLHQILIYAEREMAELKLAATANSPVLIPPFPPLVEYATDRVYRGLDPRTLFYATFGAAGITPNLVLDRVESVNFFEPGRYLVVCGVRPHFNEEMHGYVNVKA